MHRGPSRNVAHGVGYVGLLRENQRKPDMEAYLEEPGWPGAQGRGWIERKQEVPVSGQGEEKARLWIAGVA